MKNILKNNRNHTLKHTLSNTLEILGVQQIRNFVYFHFLSSFSLMARKSSKIRMKGKTC